MSAGTCFCVPDWREIDRGGSASLYVMYARRALMFFAVSGPQVAIVKWATVGTEYEQRQARAQAIERAKRLLP